MCIKKINEITSYSNNFINIMCPLDTLSEFEQILKMFLFWSRDLM